MQKPRTEDPARALPDEDPVVRYRRRRPEPRNGPQAQPLLCELIMASAPAALDSQGEATVTLHANEPGAVDLSRLLVFFAADTPPPSSQPLAPIDERARITSISVFNAHQKVRGLGHVEAPAGVFSTVRRQKAIDLGTLRLAAGDTLAVSVRTIGLEAGDEVAVGVATAFAPDTIRRLSRQAPPCGRHLYLAAPPAHHESSESLQLTLTLEQDGVVDLASLQLAGVYTAPAGGRGYDALPSTLVESIRLPSAEDLIIGNTDCYEPAAGRYAVAAPAAMFAHLGRMGEWVHPGGLKVLRGQQISIGLRRAGPFGSHAATFSAGMRFYPADPTGPEGQDGRIKASEFFTGRE